MTRSDTDGRVLLSGLDGKSDALMAALVNREDTGWMHVEAGGYEGLVKVSCAGGRCALVSTPFTLRSEWAAPLTPAQASRDPMLSDALERSAVTVAYATARGVGAGGRELVAAHDIYRYPDNAQLALDAVVDTDRHLPRTVADLAHEALHEAILERLPDAIGERAAALRGSSGGYRPAPAEIWVSQDLIGKGDCPPGPLAHCAAYLDYASDASCVADLVEMSVPDYVKGVIGELCASKPFSAGRCARDYASAILAESKQVERIARGRIMLEAARDIEPTMDECLTRSLIGKLDALLPASDTGRWRGDCQIVLSCGGREAEASARDIIIRAMSETDHLLASGGGPDGSPVDIIDVDAVMDADGNKIWEIADAPQGADEFGPSPIEAVLARPEAARRLDDAERKPGSIAYGLCNMSDFWDPISM